tara:strand:+ start:392 stop:529 length:138 start_codon:yes stop_codon:yes gene_type:complete
MDGIRTGKKLEGTRLSGGDNSRRTASYGRRKLFAGVPPNLSIRNY